MNIYSIIDLYNATPEGAKLILIDNINISAFEVFGVDAEGETIRGGYRNVIITEEGNLEILKTFETANVTLTKYDCKKFDFYELEKVAG